MLETAPATETESRPLNVRLPDEMRIRLRSAATVRGTTDAATLRWLLNHALEWWEGLSREERMKV